MRDRAIKLLVPEQVPDRDSIIQRTQSQEGEGDQEQCWGEFIFGDAPPAKEAA